MDIIVKYIKSISYISIDGNITDLSSIPVIIVIFGDSFENIFEQEYRSYLKIFHYQLL